MLELKVHNPNNLPLIDYRTIVPLQGELKELNQDNYDRLLNSLKENGFFVPFFLWAYDGKHYAVDGHQRTAVLTNEDAQPYELPYLLIEADTIAEAKQKLLVITSHYGTVTEKGLASFTAELDPTWVLNTTNFTHLFRPLNFALNRDLLAVPDGEPENTQGGGGGTGGARGPSASHDEYSTYDMLMLHTNKLKLMTVINDLKEEKGIASQEEALMFLVDFYLEHKAEPQI
jgi:hypothetical protein